MIEFFKTWTEGIIIVVFLSIIIEFLLYESKYKKLINIITNIYLIFVILNPILQIDEIEIEDLYEEIEIEDVASFDLDGVTEELFVANIKKEIMNLDGIVDVEVKTLDSGEVKSIKLKIRDINDEENLKRVITEKYGIKCEDIVVEEE